MKTPKVLIGLPTRSDVHGRTLTSLFSLSGTPETKVALSVQMGSSTSGNRNTIVKQMLERGDDYLFFIDSDLEVAPDTLTKLIKADKDIIGALYVRAVPPYNPTIMNKTTKDGKTKIQNVKDWDRTKPFKVWGIGTGAMLIKRKVLETLKDKLKGEWFKYSSIDGIPTQEDIYFCNEAQKEGFEVWCDPTIPTRHWENYGFSVNEYDANKEK